MSNQLGLLGLLLAIGGCSSPVLSRTSGGLRLLETSVAFPATFVGYPTQQSVKVENTSPADLTVHLQVSAPFVVASSVEIAGGSVASIVITFAPTTAGGATGTLAIDATSSHLSASVSGQGLETPDCQASTCHTSTFDADAGACLEAEAIDGSDCSSSALCLDHPTCQGGSCVGSTLDCDDHNACTTDACDPSAGCIHQTITCPGSTDPCQVASCDPGNGCGTQAAPDGTVCGSVDCATANICLLGGCHAVGVPDGTQCSLPTPCQAAGTCQSSECVIPDAGTLVPVWTYAMDGGGELSFNGTTDSDGNLYWTECLTSCSLVSVTSQGYVRYRAPLSGTISLGSGTGAPQQSFGLFGEVIVLATDEGTIEAHLASSGALAWIDTIDAFFSDGGSPGLWQATSLVGGPAGTLSVVAALGAYETPAAGQPQAPTELLTIDPPSGTLLGAMPYLGSARNVIADSTGVIWAATELEALADGGGNIEQLTSFFPDGGDSNSLSGFEILPSAAYGGWLFANSPGTSSAGEPVDGGFNPAPHLFLVNNFPTYEYEINGGPAAPSPVLDSSIGFVFELGPNEYPCDGPGDCEPYGTSASAVDGFDPDGGGILWTLGISSAYNYGFSSPFLTTRGTLLVTAGPLPELEFEGLPNLVPPAPGFSSLLEIDATGDVVSNCGLPSPDGWDTVPTGAALHDQRWFVARQTGGVATIIQAFDVPGIDVAPHGWVSNGGNPARTGQPW